MQELWKMNKERFNNILPDELVRSISIGVKYKITDASIP